MVFASFRDKAARSELGKMKKFVQEVYSMMTWWLEKGVDGFRMDVNQLISKRSTLLGRSTYGGLYGNSMIYTSKRTARFTNS